MEYIIQVENHWCLCLGLAYSSFGFKQGVFPDRLAYLW